MCKQSSSDARVKLRLTGYPLDPPPPPGGLTGYAINEVQMSRHGENYNVLFCDGHVSLIKWRDYCDPRKTGRNWNNDDDSHPETWGGLLADLYP